MMRKSQLIADICIKHGSCDKAEKKSISLEDVKSKTQKESRQSKHMAVAALVISVIALLIQLLHGLVMIVMLIIMAKFNGQLLMKDLASVKAQTD